MSEQIDVNELVNGLLDQIANQAREIALLKVQLSIVAKQQESAGDENVDE